MFKGFYNLASGMLTQGRVLNTISNNISNVSTPGYKKDIMVNGTFRDMVIYRTGNMNKAGTVSLETSESMIRTVQELVTNFEQGNIEETGRPLDFCLLSPGFFQIQSPEGMLYTRNGSFTLDEEGYLCLQHQGQVMGENGPIMLDSDKFNVDSEGRIFSEDGAYMGRITIADFNDYTQLVKVDEGMFQSNAEPDFINMPGSTLKWKAYESSNVNAVDEMTAMITGQRALQSAAQILKTYDQLMAKAVNDIARL